MFEQKTAALLPDTASRKGKPPETLVSRGAGDPSEIRTPDTLIKSLLQHLTQHVIMTGSQIDKGFTPHSLRYEFDISL
jgi:hypothetical protein